MKQLLALGLSAGLLAAGSAAQATDVGVSIGISQPGVYGRIDIGRFPQPAVIVPQPVLVQPAPVVVAPPEPVYLWVPPGHRKNWGKHCHEYHACGVPVYFVRHDWSQNHVMGPDPEARDNEGEGHGNPGQEQRSGLD